MKTITTAERLKLFNDLLAVTYSLGAKVATVLPSSIQPVEYTISLQLWQTLFGLSRNPVHGEKSGTEIREG
jgi:hypothetical protein